MEAESEGHSREVPERRPSGRPRRGRHALALTAGCAKKDDSEVQASGVKLVAAGKLTVCTHLPYPPFQSKDASGKVTGFDVEIMDLVAKELGVEQTIIDTPFEGSSPAQD